MNQDETKISRRTLIKRSIIAGAGIAGASLIGKACYSLLKKNKIEDLYGVYPSESSLKPLTLANRNAPKPNIILIYCDDLGYGDVSCYGSQAIRTPNIDALATDGMRFTGFYACNAICAPSRAGLLTGRYPFRTGIIGNPYPKDESLGPKMIRRAAMGLKALGVLDLREQYVANGIASQEITMAEALKVAGYRTGMIGKWHLGDYSRSPEFNPRRHGFDHYFGVPHSNDMSPCPLYRNEEQVEPDISFRSENEAYQARLTYLYTEEAKQFIQRSDDNPFFLYFAHTFPHQPLHASEKFAGKSKAGKFGDTVEEIDWSVGELVRLLKEKNLERNTMIVFTSDNGPWFEGRTVFRGRKGQSYEGGFRVPFIAKWPGKIPRGRTVTSPVMNIDLFPTFLHLAGVKPPIDRVVDGKNIFSLLTGNRAESPHEALYFYHYDTLAGIRVNNWKYYNKINRYVWPIPLDSASAPDKLAPILGNRWPLLYNLALDREESYNVIDSHPRVARRLAAMMKNWETAANGNPRGFLLP
ncbi:MAG: sulfatase [Deltaproteobacteria bacterium]|nr:sulfatase [Deltaproteobacteria bacterium]